MWQITLERLRADKGNWSAISRATGVHINTIRKIVHNETTRPRIDIVEKLHGYYEEKAVPQRRSTDLQEGRV